MTPSYSDILVPGSFYRLEKHMLRKEFLANSLEFFRYRKCPRELIINPIGNKDNSNTDTELCYRQETLQLANNSYK